MIELAYIARPLIGAVIGYITYYIAIRMLFKPRKAKYLFGVKIPLTPGLIPKAKSRIASSIGYTINKNLIKSGILEKTLLSEEMTYELRRCIKNFISTQKRNDESVKAFLCHYLSRVEIERIQDNVKIDLS